MNNFCITTEPCASMDTGGPTNVLSTPAAPKRSTTIAEVPYIKPDSTHSWKKCLEIMEEHDKLMLNGWKDELNNLLIFSGLFSAVVTAFNIESYKWLQEDPSERSVEVLERISSQLSLLSGSDAPFISTNPAGALPPFQATKTAVAINAVWFLSLTFALLAALFAILMQQWLRQYANLPQVTGRSRAHIRQRRYLALHDWLVPQLISGLSVLLQTTLFLFLGGLLAFLWTINPSVAVVITAAVATFFMAFALTTILPAMLVECPYRSPLAWVFYIASKPIAHSTAQRLYSSVHWLLWHLSDHIPRRAPIRPFLETFRFHILVRLRTTDIAPSSWYDREAQAMASPDFERDLSAVLWASRTHSSSQVEWIAHCLLDSMNPSTALFFWIARTARPQATYTQVLVAAKSTYALSYARGNWLHKDEDREVARALLEHACRYLLSESPSVPDINEAALLNMIPYLAPVHSPSHVKDYLLSVSERPDFQSSAENMSSLALQILEQHRSVSDPQTQLVQDGSLRIARWALDAYRRLQLPEADSKNQLSPSMGVPTTLADAFECSALASIAARLRELRTDDGQRPVLYKTLLDHLINYISHPVTNLRCANRVWFEELDRLIRNVEESRSIGRDPLTQRFPPCEAMKLVEAYILKTHASWSKFELSYVFGTLPFQEPQRPHLRTYLLAHYPELELAGTVSESPSS